MDVPDRLRELTGALDQLQEEFAIFGVPKVTIRDVTERPETLECAAIF